MPSHYMENDTSEATAVAETPMNEFRQRGILDPKKLSRLCGIGFKKMAGFRKSRIQLLKQYVGRFYGKPELNETRAFPINMIYQATTTLVPNLVYQDPKATISSRFMDYREYAQIASLAMDHLTDEIGIRHTLRKVITDAVFMAGFTKTGLAVSGSTLDLMGNEIDLGQPYCDRVDPDDMLLDPIARQWEEQRFIGNRFRADLETLQDSGLFDPDVLAGLTSRYSANNLRYDATYLSGGSDHWDADSVMQAVDLVEVYIPSENVVVTLPWRQGNEVGAQILRIAEYEGPEKGPYNMLGFAFVPDNILPVPPSSVWYDLHMMANKIARKAARQADRQKSVLAYEASSWQDAKGIVESMDGEAVQVDHVDAIKEVSFGGTNPEGYQYIEWAKQQFSEMAMNMDMLSGAGSDEPTATQAQMVSANTTIRLSDMQSMVYHFTGDVMKSLFFYLHTDPLIELPLIKRTEGRDAQVSYTPEMREGDWIDYNIKVTPYSMARQDPNTKVRRMLEFFGNVIPALAQAQMMLGPAFNLESSLRIMGREMGIEELDEVVNLPALQMQMQRMMQLLEQGVPVDAKVVSTIMRAQGPQAVGPGAAVAGMTGGMGPGVPGQLGQPSPYGGMQQGVTPGVEQNQGFQQGAPQPAGGF